MRLLHRKRWLYVLAGLAVITVILCWPVEIWLECRERHFAAGNSPDAVYLVAGARGQFRRIDALVNFIGKYGCAGSVGTPGFAPMLVLVGNDRQMSRWSREEKRTLTAGEWGLKRIKNRIQNTGTGAAGVASNAISSVEIVPGIFAGTDGEMKALAEYLGGHREIRSLVIVTSPFHIRRSLGRLDLYLPSGINVLAVPAKANWVDRSPWIVLLELGKIVRDSVGLSKAPLLTRKVE